MGQVEEEGPILVRVDEALRLRAEAIGQILPVGCPIEAGHRSRLGAERREVRQRRPRVIASDVRRESELLRLVSLAAEVPFADVPGRVTAFFSTAARVTSSRERC